MSDQALPYHHGNLPRALLDSAAEVIAEVGPAQMSLREVARRSGVSNAAPVHHFGDKAGLFTALAAEGYQLLAAELAEASETTGDFVAVGVAYVRFAVKHRAHFEVMFRPFVLATLQVPAFLAQNHAMPAARARRAWQARRWWCLAHTTLGCSRT